MNFNFLQVIDLFGTFAFAVSGAFLAMEKKLDPFGVLVLAFVTAIGGGTLRDIMIGDLPVAWLRNEMTINVIFVGAVAAMLFGSFQRHLKNTLLLFDALGIGLFTIYGIEKGIELHFGIGVCIALGTITASFGGVMRDVIVNDIPMLFEKEIYALACIIGGLVYFMLREINFDNNFTKIICILIIFIIRIIAVRYHLTLPRFYNKKEKE